MDKLISCLSRGLVLAATSSISKMTSIGRDGGKAAAKLIAAENRTWESTISRRGIEAITRRQITSKSTEKNVEIKHALDPAVRRELHRYRTWINNYPVENHKQSNVNGALGDISL